MISLSCYILTYKINFRHFHFPVRRTSAYCHKSPGIMHVNEYKFSYALRKPLGVDYDKNKDFK